MWLIIVILTGFRAIQHISYCPEASQYYLIIFKKLSGTWVSRGRDEVYMVVTGSKSHSFSLISPCMIHTGRLYIRV